jgi:hypothetical protein
MAARFRFKPVGTTKEYNRWPAKDVTPLTLARRRKSATSFGALAARLKSCPSTKNRKERVTLMFDLGKCRPPAAAKAETSSAPLAVCLKAYPDTKRELFRSQFFAACKAIGIERICFRVL